jgi:hypothetical protein
VYASRTCSNFNWPRNSATVFDRRVKETLTWIEEMECDLQPGEVAAHVLGELTYIIFQ